jgi:hypothetical protein
MERSTGRAVVTPVISTISTGAAVVCGLLGFHESQARRHLGPALVRAVAAVPAPPGGTPLGPTRLNLIDVQTADRTWRLPIASQNAACAATRHMVEGQTGWPSVGQSSFRNDTHLSAPKGRRRSVRRLFESPLRGFLERTLLALHGAHASGSMRLSAAKLRAPVKVSARFVNLAGLRCNR